MKRLRILPYKPGSSSARILARALNGLRLRFNGTFRPGRRHLVMNWGSPRKPRWWPETGLNNPDAVARAGDKAVALSYLRQHGVLVPDFTTTLEEAQAWVNEGSVIVGRRVLNGHGGIGCLVFRREENPQVQACPLYTKHVRHKREFRVHVFKGQVIDQVEKLKERGVKDRNPWIRNHGNGYVFARQVAPIPAAVGTEAVKAVQALGLDFGAADIAYREKEDRAYVLEVNTAPGIEGTTVGKYVEAIRGEMAN